jgi:hypothetical protein
MEEATTAFARVAFPKEVKERAEATTRRERRTANIFRREREIHSSELKEKGGQKGMKRVYLSWCYVGRSLEQLLLMTCEWFGKHSAR